MEFIEDFKTLSLLIEIAEVRLNRAIYARWQCDDDKLKRCEHRIDVAMQWADRRKKQMIQLLHRNINLIEW